MKRFLINLYSLIKYVVLKISMVICYKGKINLGRTHVNGGITTQNNVNQINLDNKNNIYDDDDYDYYQKQQQSYSYSSLQGGLATLSSKEKYKKLKNQISTKCIEQNDLTCLRKIFICIMLKTCCNSLCAMKITQHACDN